MLICRGRTFGDRCHFRNANPWPRCFSEVAVEIFLVILTLAVHKTEAYILQFLLDRFPVGCICFWFLGLASVLIAGCFILDGLECCISILQRLRVWHWLSLGSDLCFRGWSNAGGERPRGKTCCLVAAWAFSGKKVKFPLVSNHVCAHQNP